MVVSGAAAGARVYLATTSRVEQHGEVLHVWVQPRRIQPPPCPRCRGIASRNDYSDDQPQLELFPAKPLLIVPTQGTVLLHTEPLPEAMQCPPCLAP